ncbi:hypothetical protein B0H13DRAFT_1883028 [Mycena leptocephala]|nr:hypothetical protein B0H13DRAFT_1883028 [Mycena leptocephala]
MLWRMLYDGEDGHEWGRHIRSSPQPDPELLQKLDQFVPPWDVFSKPWCRLEPVEFYDVIRWLKASAAPQPDLIDHWRGDDVLEKRWQKYLEREASFHRPLQASDEKRALPKHAHMVVHRVFGSESGFCVHRSEESGFWVVFPWLGLARKPWLLLGFVWLRLGKCQARAKARRSQGQAKANGLSHGLDTNFHNVLLRVSSSLQSRAGAAEMVTFVEDSSGIGSDLHWKIALVSSHDVGSGNSKPEARAKETLVLGRITGLSQIHIAAIKFSHGISPITLETPEAS